MSGPSAESDARAFYGAVTIVAAVVFVMVFGPDILRLCIAVVYDAAAALRDGSTVPFPDRPGVTP